MIVPALDWLWSLSLGSAVRGLSLAREADLLLARLDGHDLALLNSRGEVQARTRFAGLAAACISDDGSAAVAVGTGGEVWWLAPDLTVLLQHSVGAPAVAAALDPFGRYLAVSDRGGNLHLFDGEGRSLTVLQSPRPIHHLAFVPAQPHLIAAADFGWVGCLDVIARQWLWSDRPVSHAGSLAVAGDGDPLLLACFSDGLRRYGRAGGPSTPLAMPSPCGLVSLSYTGERGVASGSAKQIHGFDAHGKVDFTHDLDQPPTALALAALGECLFVGNAAGMLRAARIVGPGG